MVFTPRFLWLVAAGILPLLLSGWYPALVIVGAVWNVVLVAAAIADYQFCAVPERSLEVTRQADDKLSVATENAVTLRIRNITPHRLVMTIRDEPPADFPLSEGETRQWNAVLPAFGVRDFWYSVTPPARGDFLFGDVFVRILGLMGLIQRQGRLSATATVAVYPNLKAIGEYELMTRRLDRSRTGLRRIRLSGGGREFAALREYTPDDEYRTIDWKATARRGKVISRTYEAERSQDILLLIDEGRLMRQEVAHSQKLDHVVNAALMLSHVVASADDRVGLLTFAEEARAWIAPRRGRAQSGAILNALYASRALPVESDYRAAFRFLSARWRKRSLAVLFTDLSDPDSSSILLNEITGLASMHLVVCVVVRDPLISARARQPVSEASQVYERAVAEEVLGERRRALNLLKKRGVLVVDAEPNELSAELVSRYLEVKQRSLI
jgi:uncharacterized protein (DUF58 family)